MTELAPGVHSLGHGRGGQVHAFLVETGDELFVVDEVFGGDARRVGNASSKVCSCGYSL